LNKEQIIKKMELELYANLVTKAYLKRTLNSLELDAKNLIKIIEEKKNGE